MVDIFAKSINCLNFQKFEEQEAKTAEDEVSNAVKDAQFNTMYLITKEGHALNQYSRVLSLQIKNKFPDLKDDKKLYLSVKK